MNLLNYLVLVRLGFESKTINLSLFSLHTRSLFEKVGIGNSKLIRKNVPFTNGAQQGCTLSEQERRLRGVGIGDMYLIGSIQ